MMPLSSARESGDVAILLVLCQCPRVSVYIIIQCGGDTVGWCVCMTVCGHGRLIFMIFIWPMFCMNPVIHAQTPNLSVLHNTSHASFLECHLEYSVPARACMHVENRLPNTPFMMWLSYAVFQFVHYIRSVGPVGNHI